MMNQKPIAFITGATSGIGEATARLLAPSHRLIICGRRKERLTQLSEALSKDTSVYQLEFDVRDQKVVSEKIDALPEEWKSIDVLVNNAGNAHGLDPFHEASVADWDAMIDINVKGLLYVSNAITPGMVEREKGHIINIGSIAGIEVYPKGHVYCASKFAVDAITQGMRQDLNPYGIRVTEIKPGLVETEFSEVRFKGDSERASQVYKGFDPLTANDVADTVRYAVLAPAHVTIADLTILPTAQASATIVKKQ